MAIATTLNFRRLIEGADPSNVSKSYAPDPHAVVVHNARGLPEDRSILRLGSRGFTVLPHRSAVTDWKDEHAITSTYYGEIRTALQGLTAAEHVFVNPPHVIRNSGAAEQAHQPVQHVHNDFTRNMKEAYVCALSGEPLDVSRAPFEETFVMQFVEAGTVVAQMRAVGLTGEQLAERRVVLVNAWQNISEEPVQRSPLAVADKSTIRASDGIDGVVGRAGLRHREGQCFYHYPRLTRDELLVFVGFDSEAAEHVGCVHAAFEDPQTPAEAPPRQSIDVRCLLVMPSTKEATAEVATAVINSNE
jgi:hypothetical protein